MELSFENSIRLLSNNYTLKGPYYTSYPAVGGWSKEFGPKEYELELDKVFLEDKNVPLSLYLHYPFCPELCTYCLCYVVISDNKDRMREFSRHLLEEIDLLIDYFKKRSIVPNVKEIHFGGGSPNVMSKDELDPLISKLKEFVDIDSLDECALEIDVRTVDREKVEYFSEKGINRISFGIQDFNHDVQVAVNRVQPIELVEKILTPDTRARFKSINFDILWGLPKQTRESFRETIKTLQHFSPDKVTLLHYGHYPDVYKHQSLINADDIPSEFEKNMMNIEAILKLEDSGYEMVGLDHLAKPDHDLAKWKKEKRLNRSFIGYSGKIPNLLGLGPSGLSSIRSNTYAQNSYGLPDYYKAVKEKHFPVFRGYTPDKDLIIRGDVINTLINYKELKFSDIEAKHEINFKNYFKKELNSLCGLVDDEVITVSDAGIKASNLGRFFVRHVSMAFDRFLGSEEYHHMPTSKKDSKLKATA